METEKSNTAYINGTGKVHIYKKLELSSNPINYEFNKFYYKELLKLLINVYEGTVLLSELKVYKIFSQWSDGFRNITKYKDGSFMNTALEEVYAEFEYFNVFYVVFFKIEKDRNDSMHYCMYFNNEKEGNPEPYIGHKLLQLAFCNTSTFKTGCVEVSFYGDREVVSNLLVEKIEPPKSNIEKIYIDDNIKNDINRFVHTFRNFDKYNFPLRYLLSGKPGLGKTEVIRSVIESCSKYGNVIIPKKMHGVEWIMFEFAKLFKPSVICIDDIDLLFGKREDGFAKKTLSSFLTVLDGILENKVFIIATTNDKNLVDIAASRPGRFDEVIDFGDFEKRFYLDLIKQKTQDDEIINLFDVEVLDYMESKKVSGAYIVNLIKQLRIIKDMNPMFSKENLMEYLQRNYKGFYKTQLKEEKTLGFGG